MPLDQVYIWYSDREDKWYLSFYVAFQNQGLENQSIPN